jgi:Uncharacterized protein required for formate dehydrogenase activity
MFGDSRGDYDAAIGREALEQAQDAHRLIRETPGPHPGSHTHGAQFVAQAVAAGIPALVSVSAPSSLAVQLARSFGLTLAGFARDGRVTVYAGEERLAAR